MQQQQGQPQQQQQAQQGQQQGQGQQQMQGQQGQAEDGPRSLWMGELQYWMDENYLWNCFAHTSDVQAVKVIRNKATGQSEGYGFVEFGSNATATQVLQTYNGAQMPQTEQPFKINWATFGGGGTHRQMDNSPEFSIFVGDLANDVTDFMLTEVFRQQYPTVKGGKVVVDMTSGRSKGYGFVRFGSEEERDRALAEMNGQYCSSRPMRISIATPKQPGAVRSGGGPGRGVGAASAYPQAQGEEDPSNTTIFVGGLDQSITDEQLRAVFGAYGELMYVKIPPGKGCGFVQFRDRASAEAALHNLHGTLIGSQSVRLSWGRNPSSKRAGYQGGGGWQQPQEQSQYGAGAGYYGAQPQAAAYGAAYDASAYGAAAAVDPSAGYGYGGYLPAYGGGYGYPQQQMPGQPGMVSPVAQGQSAGYGVPTATAPLGGAQGTQMFDPSLPPNVDNHTHS